MGSMHFRAGTIAVVRNSKGEILAFERQDRPGQWQLPQGGMDVGESVVECVWRELNEETGLGRNDVTLVDEYPEWTVYEWPDELVNPEGLDRRKRLGQAQRWFTFEAKNDEIEPIPDGVEFGAWKWVTASWLIDQVVEFRRASYQRVIGDT